MKLYLWHGLINGDQYSIYALADNLESAQKNALDSAPHLLSADVFRIIATSLPAIFDEAVSFIMVSAGQLI